MALASSDFAETKPFLSSDTEDERSENSSTAIRSSMHLKLVPWVLHLVIFVVYISLYVARTKGIIVTSTTSLHPIDHLQVRFTAQSYDDFEKSPWSGLPSPSIDAAWHHLLEHTTIRVTAQELARSNQTSVKLPEGGGYMAWLGVFHELHCIKMVRQWVYRDYYHPNLTSEEFEEWSIHADHCMDILRSAALCHADTTLTTFGWANKSKPMLNTRSINHKCVDWNALVQSVDGRVVGRDEMASLVNPNIH